MTASSATAGKSSSPGLFRLVKRAFREFMTLPVLILGGFLALTALTVFLDAAGAPWLRGGRAVLQRILFSNAEGTANLLGTLVSGLLTVVSITFSVLLLAVQQTASTLTNQVYDQFLRRKVNQIYFGYFVGLSVYALVVLATVDKTFNPVYSATCVVALSALGLCLLLLLIYSTIDQMRPAVIIHAIHDHILAARERQGKELLRRTRRSSLCPAPVRARVSADRDGFFCGLDLDPLGKALAEAGEVEVILLPSIGASVAVGDTLAFVKADDEKAAEELVPEVKRALHIHEERDLDTDPGLGVVELETVGWTTTSSAKSTPEPPRLVINALRDLLGRWGQEEKASGGEDASRKILPVVYSDNLLRQTLDALATLAVGTSESLQHVVMAQLLHSFALLLGRLPAALRRQVDDVVRRLIPALGALILTHDLDVGLSHLAAALRAENAEETAELVEAAHRQLAGRVGRLPSEQ